ncbi:hypothetical protein N431DRAFT_448673 [Stipitochalara longipes BDJ]|nr:hypothetical protein N431DRAFT_448673 [Stipitochalara longipes BDJ]
MRGLNQELQIMAAISSLDVSAVSQNCQPARFAEELSTRQPAQDGSGQFVYAIASVILDPTIHTLLTIGVSGSPWHSYNTFTIIIVFLPPSGRLFSFQDTICADIWDTCGAGMRTWSSVVCNYTGALERAVQNAMRFADLEFGDEDFEQRKPPAKRKSIHVWECIMSMRPRKYQTPDRAVPRL